MSQVYGDSIIEVVTPTITAGAYSAADQVGGLQTLAVGYPGRPRGSVLLQSVTVIDKAKQNSALDIFFWSEAPTIVADNAPASYSDADVAGKCLGFISVLATDYANLDINSVATVTNCGLLASPGAISTIYVTIVSRGTPTYAAVNDLVFKYAFGRDK